MRWGEVSEHNCVTPTASRNLLFCVCYTFCMIAKNLKNIFQKVLFTNVIVFMMFISQVLLVSAIMIPDNNFNRVNNGEINTSKKMKPSTESSVPMPDDIVNQSRNEAGQYKNISLVSIVMAVLFFLNFIILKKNQDETFLRFSMLTINIVVALIFFLVFGFTLWLYSDTNTVMMST